MSERTPMEALRSALCFAASRSCITSAEELAIMDAWNNTRPQPSAEPVAWMYERPGKNGISGVDRRVGQYIWPDWMKANWTETPLYPASALEAARREALEEFEHPDFAPLTNSALGARIAALEADNARLMGLVKEAGEALEPFAEAAARAPSSYVTCSVYVRDCRASATTLAKIKEATDA